MSELVTIIRAEIGRGGSIPFARFMELALYHPQWGYYEASRERVGFKGDFYTSVSTGELFGQLLAFRFAGWLAALPAGAEGVQIVEAGAHDGRLAQDIIAWLRQHRPEIYERLHYWIIEPSAARQGWQHERLAEFGERFQWFERLPAASGGGNGPGPVRGIIFSNELLDAFPVHRLGWDAAGQHWFEWSVTVEGDRFVWVKTAAPVELLKGHVVLPEELLRVLPDGYTIEICPAAAEWWRTAAGVLQQGRLLTFDYGFTTEEMISPSRTKGTVRAYAKHQVGDDLLGHAGEQDLTAHVNFSTVQAAGELAGLKTEGYLTQPQFLTGILGEAVKDAAFQEWNASRTRQFQTLTHPQHLGRAFKVLVQGRGNLTAKIA